MELNQLLQFKAIAECGSMSRAAEKLYISQSALSQSLAKLEAELEVPLFDRCKNKLVINDAGRKALVYADRIFADVDALKNAVTGKLVIPGVLKIGSLTKANLRYMTYLLSQKAPDTDVQPHYDKDLDLIGMLYNGKRDLIFTAQPLQDEKVRSLKLGEERMFVSVPLTNPLSQRDYLTMADLQGRKIILPKEMGPLVRLFVAEVEASGLDIPLQQTPDDMMYVGYYMHPNEKLLTTGNIARQYRHSPIRRSVPFSAPGIRLDIWLNWLDDREPVLKTTIELLQKEYSQFA